MADPDWDRQLAARRNAAIMAIRKSCCKCEQTPGGWLCDEHCAEAVLLFLTPRTAIAKYEAVYLGDEP